MASFSQTSMDLVHQITLDCLVMNKDLLKSKPLEPSVFDRASYYEPFKELLMRLLKEEGGKIRVIDDDDKDEDDDEEEDENTVPNHLKQAFRHFRDECFRHLMRQAEIERDRHELEEEEMASNLTLDEVNNRFLLNSMFVGKTPTSQKIDSNKNKKIVYEDHEEYEEAGENEEEDEDEEEDNEDEDKN